jgi:hypothetical protein
MNVYSQIRDYVKSMIREVNPKIKEHNQPHTGENIGAFQAENSYYLRVLSIPITQSQGDHIYEIPVEIEIVAKSGKDILLKHDQLLYDATCIASKVVAKKNYLDNYSNVEAQSISPEAIGTNEEWTKVTISLSFSVYIEDDN